MRITATNRRVISRVLDRLWLGILGLTVITFIARIAESSFFTNLVNLWVPMALGIAAGYSAFRLARREPMVVWTPYLWFLGAIVLYYSLGPLIYVLGSDEVLLYLHRSLPIAVDENDLLRTNLLNLVGISSIMLGLRLGRLFLPAVRISTLHDKMERHRLKLLAFWLLGIGGALQFLLILPWEFGVYDFVLPGVIYNLGKLFLFGLMTLAYLVANGEKRWSLLLYLLWGVQLLIALIHFSKAEVMVTMLLPVLGSYMANRNMKRLIFSFAIMAVVYASIAQMIHFGRYEVMKLSGDLSHASMNQRLAITQKWFDEEDADTAIYKRDLASWETAWARLSYVNVQSFAMDSYDRGNEGNTLKMAAYVLIPRVIWPDKPITTDISIDLYELVTGHRLNTHLGLGIFGEGYWNLGWSGVVILGVLTGVVFWVVGAYAIGWMASRRMEYMPGIFLGINMGLLGTTQFFSNAVVGGGGFILFYSLVVSRAFSMILSTQNR